MSNTQESTSPETTSPPVPDRLSWLTKYGMKPFSKVYPTLGKPCTYIMSRGRRKGGPCAEDSEMEEAGGPVCFNHSKARMKSRRDVSRLRVGRTASGEGCDHYVPQGEPGRWVHCGRVTGNPYTRRCGLHRELSIGLKRNAPIY